MRMKDSGSITRVFAMLITIAMVPICTGAAATAQDLSPDEAQEEANSARVRAEIVPEVVDGRFRIPPLVATTIATDDVGNGRTPTSYRDEAEAPVVPLPESAGQRAAGWNWSICNWAAPDTFSNPRYFEDRMLERHGHERFGRLQPFAAGTRFFVTIPMLPYLMTVYEPCDPEYSVGYFRSGTRAPALYQRPPYSRRAAVVEAAAIAGAFLAIP